MLHVTLLAYSIHTSFPLSSVAFKQLSIVISTHSLVLTKVLTY